MTLELWLEAYKKAYRAIGMDPTDEFITTMWPTWKTAEDLGIEQKYFRKYNEIVFTKVQKDFAKVALYDGAKELLLHLKTKGKKLALLTSTDRKLLDVAIKKHNIEHIFDFIIAGDEVANYKPHPESIEKALSALNAEKSESVIVGDAISDLGAAMNAGIDSILFYPDSHKIFYKLDELKKYKPRHTIRSFKELEKILEI